MHGQVAGAQALLAGLPARLVVLGADRLQHRNIPAKRAQVRLLGAGLGKAGGIDDQCGVDLIEPVFDLTQATGLFKAGHCNRQRIEPSQLQALAEGIDKGSVGRLQVRAIEQDRHHRLFNPPLGKPVGLIGTGFARVIHRRAWQLLRLAPGVIALQPLAGQAIEQVQGIGLATLAQEVPEPLGLLCRHGTQAGKFRVGAIITRHQDQLHATGRQLQQLLDTVAPIADATVQRHQNHLGVAQYLVDIQVDRGMVLHLHRVGQTQAGEILGQLLGGFGQQRQV
ncbi:hypothetical protein D3C81_1062370 [compost metagenome]